jgi:hypothetical protein
MPIEIQHTDDNIGIIFSAVGKVTGKEIIESQSDIYQSKGFAKLRYSSVFAWVYNNHPSKTFHRRETVQ